MSENNLETHGLAAMIPGSNPKWSAQCCYRMSNMVNSFKNHSCILFWSLGNESGNGKTFADIKETALKIDTTRPIHYEPDAHIEVSDIMSEMYTVQTQMKEIGENKPHIHSRALWNAGMGYRLTPEMYIDKPFIQCEYAHAMGNSMGNFSDYWADFKKYDRLAGVYIWDFADQAIRTKTADGKDKWNYGGDFGDKPNDSNFAFNGVFRGDRSPNPHYYEVVKCYQQIDFELSGATVLVTNRFMFTSLKNFKLRFELSTQDGVIETAEVDLPDIGHLETTKVKIPFELSRGGETMVDVYAILKTAKMQLPKGYVAAREQFVFGRYMFIKPQVNDDCSLKLENNGIDYIVSGEGFTVRLSQKTGELYSYKKGDAEFIKSGIKPNFGRANTDNERMAQVPVDFAKSIIGLNAFRNATDALKVKSVDAVNSHGCIVLTVKWVTKYIDNIVTEFKIMPDGKIEASLTCRNISLYDMPRYGLTFELSYGIDGIKYYGKGPHENYCDRKTGAFLGVYKFDKCEDFIHDYLFPQENANRCDVRWLEVGNASNKMLRVDALDNAFEASVHPYSLKELHTSDHSCYLPKHNSLTVNLDGGQYGVGGDVPAVATLKEQYKLPKRKLLTFKCLLEFFNK